MTTELKPKAVKFCVHPLPPGTTQAPTPAGAAKKAMAKVGVHLLPPGTTHTPTPAGAKRVRHRVRYRISCVDLGSWASWSLRRASCFACWFDSVLTIM